jgi:hypothetical protein
MRDGISLADLVVQELAKVPANPNTARTKQEPAPEEYHAYGVLARHHDRYGTNLEPYVRGAGQLRRVRRRMTIARRKAAEERGAS